jgi:diguanylate cyclase (GGDEF)-like protein
MNGTRWVGEQVEDLAVGAMATRVKAYPATLRCEDVERLFTRDSSLASIIVRRDDGTPLLVDRVSFLNAMVGPLGYGGSLNHERPVEALVDSTATFIIPAAYPATVAYEALLARPVAHRFGAMVVDYGDATFGALAAAPLLEQVARMSAVEAMRDPLTGLANRNCLLDSISRQLAPDGDGRPVGLLFIDLDRFKVVNDGLGHGAGDQLLVVVADRIRTSVGAGNLAARLGGDEFAVVVEARRGDVSRAAARFAERIQIALADPIVVAGQKIFVSASIGIAIAAAGESASTLIRRGDIAMYQAKRRGGGNYLFEERDDTAAAQRLDIEAWLRVALSEETLLVHYQPIVSLATASLSGFEALVRGQDASLGRLVPDQFLPVADEIGLLPEVDRFVLDRALAASAHWRHDTGSEVPVSVNLSAASLRDDALLSVVPTALDRHAIAPHLLTLEVTESAMLQNPQRSAQLLDALHERGVRIAVDDFGTGYSSLTQLTTFHPDILKIDRSFVSRLRESVADQQVVSLVLALARGMRAGTVAEGIEELEQSQLLEGMGCDAGQGYLYAAPFPEAAALEAVRRSTLALPAGGLWRLPAVA